MSIYSKLLRLYKHGERLFSLDESGKLYDASGALLADLSPDLRDGIRYSPEDILHFLAATLDGRHERRVKYA